MVIAMLGLLLESFDAMLFELDNSMSFSVHSWNLTSARGTVDVGELKAMNDRILLRPAEAADAIGVADQRHELIAAGQIPSVKLGGCVRVPVVALQAWIERQLSERATSL